MKKLIVLLSFLICALSVQAQFGHGVQFGHGKHGLYSDGKGKPSKEQKADEIQRDETTSSQMFTNQTIHRQTNVYNSQNMIDSKDFAYYAKIVKKNGWLIGVGKKLTKDEAGHLNCYYKLSKKNKAGNWTYIEAFDGYGNPTTYHNIGTYLANQYDDDDRGLNNDWREKLQSVCKWEMVADASGQEVVQERALDSKGDIVYIFSPIKVGEREYTGSFTDGWGMPIFMRTDSLGNDVGFANYVHITRDERGFEVLLSYTDRFGFPQKNKDGAYMTRSEYDDFGNHLKEASQNIVGDNMIDDFGNCGWESTYDKNGWQTSARYYDADWNPIRMPNLRGGSGKVYGFHFEQDEFGRDTATIIIDEKSNPDINEFGIHKIKRVYNDYGYWTFTGYYDLEGNLHAGDRFGVAQIVHEFDKKGNIKLIEYKDENGLHVVNSNEYCKKTFDYDKNGVEISEIEYITNNRGDLIKSFEYYRDNNGNTVRTWYQKNKQRVDSVDSKGRNVLLAWYDLEGKSIEHEGLHKNVTKYDDENGVETEIWLDKLGNQFVDDERGYSQDIRITDATSNIMTNYQYWHGALKQSFQKQYTPGFETITAQWDITPYGEHARVGWWNNLHYTCKVDYTMYGKIRTMVGRNEFDEPSYLTFLGNSGEVYYFSDINNGNRRYYDEYGIEIPDSLMDAFKSKLPRVFCIEVTDTIVAYPLGLKNGDVIISYGDWTTDKNLITYVDYFYLETILKANQDKQITLLRHHPETGSSEILHKNLPKGKTSDLGFYPHKIYYTQKEKHRLLNTCEKYRVSFVPHTISKDTTILLAVQTKGGFEETRLYHLPMYNIKDPGVVLYAKERYNKGVDTWSLFNTIDKWESQKMFRIKGANLYITQDLTTIRHIDKQSRGLGGMRFVPIKVDIDTYNKLLKCYNSLGESITSEKKSVIAPPSTLKLKEKELRGIWMTIVNVDGDDVSVTLELSKGGEASFQTETKLQDESMSIGLLISSIGGIWSLQNGCITFDFENATTDFDITSFDMPGIDEEQKDAMVTLLRGFFENEKSSLLETYGITQIFNTEVFAVMKVTSKELVVMDGTDERFFEKIKKK